MKCKLVVNSESGNVGRLDIDVLLCNLGCDASVEIIDGKSNWSAEDFDTVIVCGGDGTLNNAVKKCRGKRLIYVPCGTLNETAATENKLERIAQVNDMPFSYVCAAGSFTEIGYSAQNRDKKRWKAFAYLPQVLKNYRCHEISAEISADGKNYDGVYTLIMVLKSHRCFGFCFNKDYKTTKKNYLVAIKSVGKDCFFNKIRMFFPFFRVFFCGAKPCVKNRWLLLPFDRLTLRTNNPQYFCVDGEKRLLDGVLEFSELNIQPPIEIVRPPKTKFASKFKTQAHAGK